MSHRQPRIQRERAVEKRLAVNRTVNPPEHVAQIGLNLGLAQWRGLQLRVKSDLLRERRVFGRVYSLDDVILQFLLDGSVIGLKSLLKAFVHRFAPRQGVDVLAELRPPPAGPEEAMGERPRLGIKQILLVALDVKRRSLIDRQQG